MIAGIPTQAQMEGLLTQLNDPLGFSADLFIKISTARFSDEAGGENGTVEEMYFGGPNGRAIGILLNEACFGVRGTYCFHMRYVITYISRECSPTKGRV